MSRNIQCTKYYRIKQSLKAQRISKQLNVQFTKLRRKKRIKNKFKNKMGNQREKQSVFPLFSSSTTIPGTKQHPNYQNT